MKLKLLLTSNDFRKTKSSWVRKMIIVLHSYSFRTESKHMYNSEFNIMVD